MPALHVKTAAEGAARLQDPVRLPVGSFLVGEGVKAVEGQHDIEAPVFKRQCANVALQECDTALGRLDRKSKRKPPKIPTQFSIGAIMEHYDNPATQAEYVYSRLNSEVV